MTTQTIAFPEFYMPYPVRVNPHLENLREGSEVWACEMGMISGGEDAPHNWALWDLDAFHAMATDELAAFIFPDASAADLALLHQLMVWHFAWDDFFAKTYKSTHDQAGARAFTDRLRTFMPLEVTDAATPELSNVVERCTADLWPRLMQDRPRHWRRQVARGLTGCIEAGVLELANVCDGRIPDPIEYVTFRRESFAAHAAGCYVSMSTGTELPERIRQTRPVCALVEAFMDYMGLDNDIFSYHRELYEEADTNNLVKVFENFLGINAQAAVHVANNLLKARIRHINYIVDSQLPPLMDTYDLDTKERADVATWLAGAQSYLSGIHAWHTSAPRYRTMTP
jgi:germacradienol/geosmin synthase